MMGDDSRRVRLGSLVESWDAFVICREGEGRGRQGTRRRGRGEEEEDGGMFLEEMYRPYLPRTHNKRNPPQNADKENEEQRGTM